VTLWSPPHLLGLLGSAVNTLGALLIATESYPPRSPARLAALLVGSALLYGGVRVVLEPSWLTAYTHGGVAFHAFAILGALLLPVALVPATRLVDRRWAPVTVLVIAVAITLGGEQIARVGFAIVEPTSVIGEEIQKDPTSPIALAASIRARNRTGGLPLPIRLLLPIAAAAVLAGVDPRRRPALACVAYGVTLFALYGWSTSRSPAFALMAPTTLETGAALAITVVSAYGGSILGRHLADLLEPPTRATVTGPAALTSPAR
jgi:hypothetical protein